MTLPWTPTPDQVLTNPQPEPASHFTLYKSTHHHVPSPHHYSSNLNRRCMCSTHSSLLSAWLEECFSLSGCSAVWRVKGQKRKKKRSHRHKNCLQSGRLSHRSGEIWRWASKWNILWVRLFSASQMQWSEINSVTQCIMGIPWPTCFCVKASPASLASTKWWQRSWILLMCYVTTTNSV